VEGLHRGTRRGDLVNAFRAYSGFVEVRHIPEKEVAFVEFQTDHEAANAMRVTNNQPLRDGTMMQVSFAKK